MRTSKVVGIMRRRFGRFQIEIHFGLQQMLPILEQFITMNDPYELLIKIINCCTLWVLLCGMNIKTTGNYLCTVSGTGLLKEYVTLTLDQVLFRRRQFKDEGCTHERWQRKVRNFRAKSRDLVGLLIIIIQKTRETTKRVPSTAFGTQIIECERKYHS